MVSSSIKQPPSRARPSSVASSSSSSSHSTTIINVSSTRVDWDPWPNGDFHRTFTWKEFHASGQLAVNWACEPIGGDKSGRDDAVEWSRGKKAGRRCRGIIRCANPTCSIIVRPQTRMRGIQKQILESCRCGSELIHADCGIVSRLYSFAGGVHYINGGLHDHLRPTHILHLTRGQREKFTRIIQDHPNIGPLSLLVGRPGLHGPEPSVAEISPVLFNKDRIKSERRAVKQEGNLGKSEFEEFAQFERDRPGFVVFSQFGAVTVVVMQTPFMVTQLVKNHMILRDAINGIVSDGAHGYFIDPTALLLMSSSYCLDLDCWVPGIMTYANGATQEHFFFHFLVMFESMASYAGSQGRTITDSDFKNVVDFSEAERQGFVRAFVAFWKRRKDNTRTDEELTKAGSALLKGCQEHFRAQVTRIKKISAVVHPGLKDVFANQALALLHVEDFPTFTRKIEKLIKEFPRTEGWARWWARECHAMMLFKPFRKMTVQDWESIPDTTNAQESQHRKIYAAIGKKHQLIPGLKGLHQLAEHYALLAAAASSGVKVRYGIPEDWKYSKGKDGLTRRSRRRNRKDGRPPDTSEELVGHISVAQKLPSYRWHRNSCYFDTSLELIFQTVSQAFDREFGARSASLHPDELLKKLFDHMSLRRTVESDNAGGASPTVLQTLALQRDGLRKSLAKARVIPEPYQYNPLFAWLEGLLSRQQDRAYSFARSYFHSHHILLRACSGDPQTPQHWQLKKLKANLSFTLSLRDYQVYQGDVERWFRGMLLINRQPERLPTCWRRLDDDGEKSCSGSATILQLVLGIPVMLILEIPGNEPNQWNFPPKIRPSTLGAECTHGVVYDLVGRAFTNGSHFKAHFTRDGKHVYAYDDMQNEGAAMMVPNSRISTHLAGEMQVQGGWRTYAVVYRLRGGSRAQSFFTRYQCAASERLQSVRFSPPSVDSSLYEVPEVVGLELPDAQEMALEDRFWLHNPWKTGIIDFVSRHKPLGKSKRVRFHNEDGTDSEDHDGSQLPTAKKHRKEIENNDELGLGAKSSKAAKRRPHRSNLVILSDDEPTLISESSQESGYKILTTDRTQDKSGEPDCDEEVLFDCRCGYQGNVFDGIPELFIQCTVCNARSHIACQRNGSASSGKELFRCDSCRPPSEVLGVTRTQPRKRKKKTADTAPRTSLSKRLLPGKGALARHGTYWYPVRLIFKETDGWVVKWWRGNKFNQEAVPPNKVSETDIRDELWANAFARRQIRLGQWMHANEAPNEEDMLFAFRDHPYTHEIDTVLRPHLKELEALLTDPDGDHPDIPALEFARAQKKSKTKTTEMLRQGGIPYTGDLRSIDCARVANWFYNCVAGAKEATHMWLGRVPLGHAYTILIASHHRQSILDEIQGDSRYTTMERQTAIFHIAWGYQVGRPTFRFTDVDRECLGIFEERLFEDSHEAGRAGNQQWGLDVGPHQDGWSPYINIPTHWNHNDREDESESELQVGSDHSHSFSH
ncbi:hypothetical protein B0H15DRAFT_782057 [Mycena belliarum]|uniref:Uncharacterized protein n=1 Tax=Mycena belliarum TaxID=1033014 RepID=A0AAD6U3G3_9AGAR|nr:hypothetical protein B0H15DRAFT_782057 [Mycena belliae]